MNGGPSQDTFDTSGFHHTSKLYAGKHHVAGNTSRVSDHGIHLTGATKNQFDNTTMSEKPGSSLDYNDELHMYDSALLNVRA